MTVADLKIIFEKDYNRAEWTSALRDIFHIKNLHIIPHAIDLGDNPWEASALELGFFETSEGLLVGLYEVNVPSHKSLNGKVGLRNLMRKVYTNDADAALIVFSQGTSWRFSYASELTIENKETGKRERRQTDPKRYTYIFGRHQLCRTAAERFAILKTSTDLFDTHISIAEIEKAFSVDTLTKDFYRELSNWYFWALQHVQFPDDAEKDAEIRNSSNTIRLITRLIFVWFLKQKGLIPEELFKKDKVFALLKHQGKNSSAYYKAILQNLFFATLNQEMGKRAFRREGQHYNITNLFRYEKLFVNPSEATELFKGIPFLNGGLFECLDKPHPTEKTPQGSEKIVRVDGFSDREVNKIKIPDYLFFGGAESVDLNEAYGDSRHNNLKVRGIIDILNSYNFTVEENTPIDIQVALDPELLGKVFENLLASYNPETKTTARKQTGSFYTPREIVSYMVDESLIAYFKQKMESESSLASTDEKVEASLRELLSYSGNGNPFSESETKTLVQAVDDIKILDPACGSGAFPMGVLQQLVHALQKLDPNNIQWKHLQMHRAQNEIQAAVASGETESFASRLKDIAESFENNVHDYGRKLFLIENCIYGVDIQPIAVQIAKLRFFISLLCEQNINRESDNLGIRALPNLETKFVAANTLIGLDVSSTFKPDSVYALEKQLEEVRHSHFSARTPEKKRKYRERDNQLCKQIADILVDVGFPGTSADQIANWNPYNQNIHAPFFDKYWMFGIEDGFNVVIGNPPFISYYARRSAKLDTATLRYFQSNYAFITDTKLDGKFNSIMFFIESACNLLSKNGSTFFILDIAFNDVPYRYIRKYLLENCSINKLLTGLSEFENVYSDQILLQFNKAPKEKRINNLVHYYSKFNVAEINVHEVEQELWLLNKLYEFALPHNNNLEIILQKIEQHPPLQELFPSKLIRTCLSLAGHEDEFLLLNNKSKKGKPVLNYIQNAKNLPEQYSVILNPDKVVYDEELRDQLNQFYRKDAYNEIRRQPKALGLGSLYAYTHPKLFVRQSADKIIATYTDIDCAANTSFYIISETNEDGALSKIKLKYLLGILNSKLLSFYALEKKIIITGTKKQPQMMIKPFKTIPIANNKTIGKNIVSFVDKILSAKSKNQKENTLNLEKQVDELVYKLYDLTYDEVKVIDPEFWLSEEEYEKVKIE